MPQYVAFLRAINVSGRFIKMAALADHFHTLGHSSAKTFINSGNVLLQSRVASSERLAASIEEGLEPLLGFRSEVFVRSAPHLQAIAAKAQALRSQVGPDGDVNVAFLARPLAEADHAAVLKLHNAMDDFLFGAQEVYWLCQTRQSDSKFSNAVLERTLRTRCTLRKASMLQNLVVELQGSHG
ncbi:MAG: DUF1697 domain-containing protein [Rhodoferax sp.]|jgi:uncharacterized protein (DUF1697 family)